MQMIERPQNITLAEMREMGLRLVYCADYQCSHSAAIETAGSEIGFAIARNG